MALIGYMKTPERKNGGIRTLGLISCNDIQSVSYLNGENAYDSITLVTGKKFTRYDFREDEAEYTEKITLTNGSAVVTHELRFMLDKMGLSATRAITSLLNTSSTGLIALVVTPNDERFLVGYSPAFVKERPLRVVAVSGTTGKQLRDETTEVVTLQSVDTEKTLPFQGDLESLF